MTNRVVSLTRFLVAIPIAGAFAGTLVLLYAGSVTLVMGAKALLGAGGAAGSTKQLAGVMVKAMDLYLLAIVFYIIALGLWELFIDDKLPVPHWLEVHTLDDLKESLVRVVIVVMAVIFLGELEGWDGQANLLPFGIAIAAVIAALSYFLRTRES